MKIWGHLSFRVNWCCLPFQKRLISSSVSLKIGVVFHSQEQLRSASISKKKFWSSSILQSVFWPLCSHGPFYTKLAISILFNFLKLLKISRNLVDFNKSIIYLNSLIRAHKYHSLWKTLYIVKCGKPSRGWIDKILKWQ